MAKPMPGMDCMEEWRNSAVTTELEIGADLFGEDRVEYFES